MGHNYGGKPASNMMPQRGGSPRNTGSPPPDLSPAPYSRPAQTQAAPPPQPEARGSYQPQPDARPHERGTNMAKQGSMPDAKPGTMGQRPTGTAVPERRSAKGGRGDGGAPGQVGGMIEVPLSDFNIANPTPTEGYRRPGRGER